MKIRLPSIKPKMPPSALQRRIEESIYKFNSQLRRLDALHERFRGRERELFEKCVQAKESKQEQLARVYATECAEVRKILRGLDRTRAVLEQTILRLQTAMRLNELMSYMGSVSKIAKKAHVELKYIPTTLEGLEDLGVILSSMIPEAPEAGVEAVPAPEEEETLKEAAAVASHVVEKEAAPRKPIPEAEVQSVGAVEPDEQEVRKYLEKAAGEVDPARCARDLGYPLEEVKRILERLTK